MAEIKIGDANVQIANNLYAMSQMKCADPSHWYTEVYGKLPVYNYFINIHRTDEDEDFDIYNVIFNDLVETGDFTPLLYEYNKSRNNTGRNRPRLEIDVKNDNEIYTERYYVVSNTDPIMIVCEYEGLTIMSHTGTKVIDEFYDKYLKDTDIDLILSGHVHGGQMRVLGKGIFSPGQGLFPKYFHGFHDNRLIVSAGTSNTVSLPRWGNPCEVVIINLSGK
jgi:predicted MPP superfamily phosphohydrolase